MSKNIEQFSLYVSAVLEYLYDRFPIESSLPEEQFIQKYLSFIGDSELKERKIKRDIADLVEMIPQEEVSEDFEFKKLANNERLMELESLKSEDSNNQVLIYRGTVKFLESESLIRMTSKGKYQLTSKSFSHLNKRFESGSLENEQSTIIKEIKGIVSKLYSASSDKAIGLAVDVVARLLSFS